MNEFNTTENVDLIKLIYALKENVLKDCHVAGIYKVEAVHQEKDPVTYSCRSITNNNVVVAYKLRDLPVLKNDLVLILYCDDDFRANYRRLGNNQPITDVNTKEKHSLSYGVIIGQV